MAEVGDDLDDKLTAMQNNSVAQIRIAATASFTPFTSGQTYWGELRKSTAITYSSAILYGLGANKIIYGYRGTGGWSFKTVTLS